MAGITVAEKLRPFCLYTSNAVLVADNFGANHEQEQLSGSVRPSLCFVLSATPPTQTPNVPGPPCDPKAGSIVWAIKRLHRHLVVYWHIPGTNFTPTTRP